jgi:hypothetical protein
MNVFDWLHAIFEGVVIAAAVTGVLFWMVQGSYRLGYRDGLKDARLVDTKPSAAVTGD